MKNRNRPKSTPRVLITTQNKISSCKKKILRKEYVNPDER